MTANQTVLDINGKDVRHLTRDMVWFGLAQIFSSFILGFLTLPALTKNYSTDVFGIWTQVNITVALVSPLLSLQLGLAAVKFLAGEDDRRKRQRILGVMFSIIFGFLLLVVIIGLLLLRPISELLFATPNYNNYALLTVIWTAINSVYYFFDACLQARRQIRAISINMIVVSIVEMALFVSLAYAGFGMEIIIWSQIITQTIFSCLLFAVIYRENGLPHPNLEGARSLLSFSLPQIPAILLLWTISTSDRYFITHFFGLSETGIYTPSTNIANLVSVIFLPVSYAIFPMLSRLWTQQRKLELGAYQEYSLKYFLVLSIPVAIGITFFSQPLLGVLTTSEFMAGENLVLLLTAGAICLGIYKINVNMILLGRHSRLIPLMTGIGASMCIILDILLIPRIGIIGAAISNCLSYMALAITSIIWSKRTVNYNLNWQFTGKLTVSSCVMFASMHFLNIGGLFGLVVSAFVGGIVFVVVLLLLRTFSGNDAQMAKDVMISSLPITTKLFRKE